MLVEIALGVLVLLVFGVHRSAAAGDRPEYTIYRAGTPITVDGRLDEPAWTAAPDVGAFTFPWYKEGKKEQTVAKMLWDDENLYVAYICEDAHISAERVHRDSEVWKDDCVEVFTAPNPDTPDVYFNIEMNCIGAFLDQFHPDGPGVPMKEEWDGEGIRISTHIEGTLNDESDEDAYWILEAAIPFRNFAHVAKHAPPKPGDVWHLNLNRLGGNVNAQSSQWSPADKDTRTFHDPGHFGRVTFSEKASPFWR